MRESVLKSDLIILKQFYLCGMSLLYAMEYTQLVFHRTLSRLCRRAAMLR